MTALPTQTPAAPKPRTRTRSVVQGGAIATVSAGLGIGGWQALDSILNAKNAPLVTRIESVEKAQIFQRDTSMKSSAEAREFITDLRVGAERWKTMVDLMANGWTSPAMRAAQREAAK